MGRTTVFCQAAGIQVPCLAQPSSTPSSRTLAPRGRAPGVRTPCSTRSSGRSATAARSDGTLFHRVVVGSRNLTLDSSWDTALDARRESPTARSTPPLPASHCRGSDGHGSWTPLTEERRDAILDLVADAGGTCGSRPRQPFTGWNVCSRWGSVKATPSRGRSRSVPRKVLAISPFLAAEHPRADSAAGADEDHAAHPRRRRGSARQPCATARLGRERPGMRPSTTASGRGSRRGGGRQRSRTRGR
jgi:hypothetical protein